MKVKEILLAAERLTRENSSSILTALGVTGTVTTAYLAAKASFKAGAMVTEQEIITNHRMDAKELFQTTWRLYIPAGTAGTLTVVCILGAAKINSRRTAALTAAYSLSERAYAEYKEKIIETLGEKKEQKVRDEIAQDRIERNPPTQGVILVGTGDVLCHEAYTGRYFNSNMETLRKAQNDVNAKMVRENEATLSDFYYMIGVPQTSFSSYSGWKSERMMDLSFSTLLHDGKPCLSFEYNYVTTV
jgi:hypothetical protein